MKSKGHIILLSLTLVIFYACKQDTSEKTSKATDRVEQNSTENTRTENRDFGSKDLIATEGRKAGNVLHVPPQKNTNHEKAYRLIYEGLFTKEDKVGQSTSMSMFTFNQTGTEIREFNQDEMNGLAQALKDNPNVKIQIQSHSNSDLSITHSRANSVKQKLFELGVSADQVNSIGKGRENKAKAAGNLISIKFLQI